MLLYHSAGLVAKFGSIRVRNAEVFELLQGLVRKDGVHTNLYVDLVVSFFTNRQDGDVSIARAVIDRFRVRAHVTAWMEGGYVFPNTDEYNALCPSDRIRMFVELCSTGYIVNPGECLLNFLKKRPRFADRLSHGLQRYIHKGGWSTQFKV